MECFKEMSMYQARFLQLDTTPHICVKCGHFRISEGRFNLLRDEGKRMLCMPCGDKEAKVESKRNASMVQIPYSKGAYQYIHNPDDLRITNPKRTT